jgi:hypothetical protein
MIFRACLVRRIISDSAVNRSEQFQTARNWNISPPNRSGSIREKQSWAWNGRKGVSTDSHLRLPLLPPLPSWAGRMKVPQRSLLLSHAGFTPQPQLASAPEPRERPPLSHVVASASPATHPCETPASKSHRSCRLTRPCVGAALLPWPLAIGRERERTVPLDKGMREREMKRK